MNSAFLFVLLKINQKCSKILT